MSQNTTPPLGSIRAGWNGGPKSLWKVTENVVASLLPHPETGRPFFRYPSPSLPCSPCAIRSNRRSRPQPPAGPNRQSAGAD